MSGGNSTESIGEEQFSGDVSVAHQIIGMFIDELKLDHELIEVSNRLSEVVYSGKPTEIEIRNALFGGVDL